MTNNQGQIAETWIEGFRDFVEARRISETSAQFIMRYRSNITPASHRILHWGARWALTNVVPDRNYTMLTIDSDFSSLIEVTHLQSTEREFIDASPALRPPE